MTVSSALAPFDLPHKGQCLCAECPWGKWCNYCIMKMVPAQSSGALIFINRMRPEPPLFLSRNEAITVAQGLAQSFVPGKDFGGNRFKAALVECMKRFAEAWGVKQARELLGIVQWTQFGDPTAWPEPDTHDEWRKLNDS